MRNISLIKELSENELTPQLSTTTPEKDLDIFLLSFFIFFIFKSSITPLIFIFITYYYFANKKREREILFFKANFIYTYFIIFVNLVFVLSLFL